MALGENDPRVLHGRLTPPDGLLYGADPKSSAAPLLDSGRRGGRALRNENGVDVVGHSTTIHIGEV